MSFGHVVLAVQHDWSGQLINFVSLVYGTSRSAMVLQNLDFSFIFDVLLMGSYLLRIHAVIVL
jgi:hypothetical protein